MNRGKVLVAGAFNVLHPGHIRLLRFARECGDKLIVAVHSDRLAAAAAHVPEQLRLEGILSNSWVDEAFILDEPVNNLISQLRPDIVVKGREYESSFNPEAAALEQYGGKLLFSSGENIFSSIDLIRKEFESFKSRPVTLPKDYLERHGLSVGQLVERLDQFTKLRVCVVGDVIVDEYITCEPLGMSQEDPTIVVTPVDSISFVGGAGIVAAHAANLGASVQFVSVTGNDSARDFILEKLAESNVETCLLVDASRPTTLKQRFRSKGKSLLRVSHLHQRSISLALQKEMLQLLEKMIDSCDLLVFSDFNYGCLPQILVDQIIYLAKKSGVMIAADSQSSSQIGDIGRFKSVDLLTPTEREARISTRNREDGLVILAEQLRQQSSAENILLKLGDEGLLIHATNDGSHHGWLTDRIDALNSNPKDVAGAGDSLLITSALTLAGGGSIWEAACLGSLAAAIQVGRVGNTPILASELLQELV
jgi:rfaE bifunctional protein kinase chain/domain